MYVYLMIKCRLIKEFIEKKTYVLKRYRLKIIWRDALHKKTYESYYIPKNLTELILQN